MDGDARGLMSLGSGALSLFVVGWLLTWPEMPPAVPKAAPMAHGPALPPAQNAFTTYMAGAQALRYPERLGRDAGREVKITLTVGIDKWQADVRPAIADAVRQNAAALAHLRRGRHIPGMQMSPPGHSVETPLPSFVSIQDLARFGNADMRLALEAGRHEAGLQRALDLFSLGRRMTYAYDDVMVTELVGAVMTGLALDSLKEEQSKVMQAPTPALKAFLQDLNRLDALERPLEQYLVGERDNTVRSAPVIFSSDGAGPMGLLVKVFPVEACFQTYTKNLYDLQMERAAARDWKGMTALIDHYTEIGPREWASVVFHPAEGTVRVLGTITMTSFQGAAAKILRQEARFDALRIRVAMELYRREHGRAAARLEELAGLPDVPVDPFKPQQELRFAGGRLWSVGWDGLDQQGKIETPVKEFTKQPGDLLL